MTIYDRAVEWFKNNWLTTIVLIIVIVLINLPRVKEGVLLVYSWIKKSSKHQKKSNEDKPFELEIAGEKIVLTELLHSAYFDVVKVYAHTHHLGINAEHEWIKRKYPDAKALKQALTTLDRLSEKLDHKSSKIHFDRFTIEFPNRHTKEIYFDITSFFDGTTSSMLDLKSFEAKKIKEIYD